MKRKIENFLALLRELQEIDHELPLQYAVCLVEISLDEGQSLTQLSKKTGMALSTISRIVGALSKHRQKGQPYGLVKVVVSKAERRRKELYLTAKGKTLISNLEKIMS